MSSITLRAFGFASSPMSRAARLGQLDSTPTLFPPRARPTVRFLDAATSLQINVYLKRD